MGYNDHDGTVTVNVDNSAVTALEAETTANKKTISSFTGLNVALDMQRASCAIQVIGDSTGNDTTDWVYLLSTWLAENYPNWNIHYRLWSDTTQNYTNPIIRNAPVAGLTGIGGGTNTRLLKVPTVPHIAGDMDIAVKIKLADWTPTANVTPVSRYASGIGSWYLTILPDGKIRFIWTPDGSLLKSHVSTVAVPFTDGDTKFIRVTFDADNGSGGCTATFYTSNDGITSTTLGTPVTLAEIATLNNNETQPYELGGRGQSGEILPTGGVIYEVHIKDGIDGFNVAPIIPDLWEDRGNGLSHAIIGAPTLTIVNGSHPGASIAYLGETTRINKLIPDFGQAVIFLSSSHNEGFAINNKFRQTYASMIASIESRLPYVPIVAIAQNPQQPTTTVYKEHDIRRSNILEVAKTKNIEVIDVYSSFPLDDLPTYMLDSVHPNLAGSQLWRDKVIEAMT